MIQLPWVLFMNECDFNYYLSEKDEILIITLIGEMTESAIPKLKECIEEMKVKNPQFVAFNLHDINKIGIDGVRLFAHMQKLIREKPAKIRICFLETKIKERLIKEGIVREGEIVDNLGLALKSFKAT